MTTDAMQIEGSGLCSSFNPETFWAEWAEANRSSERICSWHVAEVSPRTPSE